MAVARCVEDFTNAQLIAKLEQAVAQTTDNAYPVRSVSQQDPHSVLFFADQVRERSADDLSVEETVTRTQMAKVVDAVAKMAPALRTDYKAVAAAIQDRGVFSAPAEDKWAVAAKALPALRN